MCEFCTITSPGRKCWPFLCICKSALARGSLCGVDVPGRRSGENFHGSRANNFRVNIRCLSVVSASATSLWRCFHSCLLSRHCVLQSPRSASLISPSPLPSGISPKKLIYFLHLRSAPTASFSPTQIHVYLCSKQISQGTQKKKRKSGFPDNKLGRKVWPGWGAILFSSFCFAISCPISKTHSLRMEINPHLYVFWGLGQRWVHHWWSENIEELLSHFGIDTERGFADIPCGLWKVGTEWSLCEIHLTNGEYCEMKKNKGC